MTKVDFYTGSADKLRTACQLSHKAMQNGLRVLLHTPDEAAIEALDKLLWRYPDIAFIPHCSSDSSEAGHTPVVLNHRGDNFPHHELLINLHDECVSFFSRFQHVKEIVGQNAEDKILGRARFKFYQDRGYELRHFDLTVHNK